MFTNFQNPNTLKLADIQRRHVEALARNTPSLDTPLIDHMRDLLDAASTRKEPEVESLCEWARNRLNAER